MSQLEPAVAWNNKSHWVRKFKFSDRHCKFPTKKNFYRSSKFWFCSSISAKMGVYSPNSAFL